MATFGILSGWLKIVRCNIKSESSESFSETQRIKFSLKVRVVSLIWIISINTRFQLEFTTVTVYHLSKKQLKMKEIRSRPECQKFALAVISIIKKIQSSEGAEKAKFLQKVKNQFQISEDERWVVTKLRMILVRLGVNVELLQLRTSEKKNWNKSKTAANVSRKETTNLTNKHSDNVNEKEKKSVRNVNSILGDSKKQRKRLSVEEKQLTRIRTNIFDEIERSSKPITKTAFLEVFGLVPKVIDIV